MVHQTPGQQLDINLGSTGIGVSTSEIFVNFPLGFRAKNNRYSVNITGISITNISNPKVSWLTLLGCGYISFAYKITQSNKFVDKGAYNITISSTITFVA